MQALGCRFYQRRARCEIYVPVSRIFTYQMDVPDPDISSKSSNAMSSAAVEPRPAHLMPGPLSSGVGLVVFAPFVLLALLA